jgi:hypothetical protein
LVSNPAGRACYNPCSPVRLDGPVQPAWRAGTASERPNLVQALCRYTGKRRSGALPHRRRAGVKDLTGGTNDNGDILNSRLR